MYRAMSVASITKKAPLHGQVSNHIAFHRNQIQTLNRPCKVFISHRGSDTKRNVASLLHKYLWMHGLLAFLDCKTLKPGHKLSREINGAIHGCKVGIALISPGYCESWYCLHELALLMEARKRLIPIFWDVNPSRLMVLGRFPPAHAKRFGSALEEARKTVGITFDSSTGDWSKLLEDAYDAVLGVLSH